MDMLLVLLLVFRWLLPEVAHYQQLGGEGNRTPVLKTILKAFLPV
jgi:hypothetical protein